MAYAARHSHSPTCLLPQALSKSVGKDVVATKLLPTVLGLAGDAVPNIRFNVAKVLAAVTPQLDAPVVAKQVRPCLLKLAEDYDADVKYYATKALAKC